MMGLWTALAVGIEVEGVEGKTAFFFASDV